MLIQLWKSMIVAYLYEKNFDQAFLVSSDYMAALDKIYPTYHPTKSFLAYSMFLIAPNVTGVTGKEYFDATKRALEMLVMTHGAGHVLSVEVGRAMDAFRERFPDALPRR